MASVKVLLVDDEVDFAQVIAERLRTRDFEVDTANSGLAGLEMVRAKRYDAIVLDLAMPEMDGFETMKRMLQIDPDLQIIILTGHGSVAEGVEAIKEGAADFLEKPADIDLLIGKLGQAQQKRITLFEENLTRKMSGLIRKKGW